MKLPGTFISTIRNTFRESGDKFLVDLPDLIDEASRQWGLTDVQTVPTLSYNYVAFAKQGREDVVLKVGVPNRELTSEIAALKFFDGNGACQLLESDAERGLLLLERLEPGKMLAELEDDDERTRIAADLISRRGEVTSPLPPYLRIYSTICRCLGFTGHRTVSTRERLARCRWKHRARARQSARARRRPSRRTTRTSL